MLDNAVTSYCDMIPVGDIEVPADRLRSLKDEKVTEISESMRERGLLYPTLVRKNGGAGPAKYILVDG